MEPLRHVSVVRFGTYEVSLQSGEVRKAGVRIRVQQQPLKLLEALLERPGEVVTREELRSRVWPNESFGDFDQAVNIAIAKLRSALGDSAENPRYIETLPKRGYRFIADVSFVDADGRIRRPEFRGLGDLAGSRQQESRGLGTDLGAVGRSVGAGPGLAQFGLPSHATPAMADTSHHPGPGACTEFGDSFRLFLSFASAMRPPPSGLWRCFR